APVSNPVGPFIQSLFGITALILASRAVQANVGEVGSDQDGRVESGELVNAVGCVVAPQNCVNFVAVPAWLAELEGIAIVFRQRLQKLLEPFKIHLPFWRKLKQDGTQFLA